MSSTIKQPWRHKSAACVLCCLSVSLFLWWSGRCHINNIVTLASQPVEGNSQVIQSRSRDRLHNLRIFLTLSRPLSGSRFWASARGGCPAARTTSRAAGQASSLFRCLYSSTTTTSIEYRHDRNIRGGSEPNCVEHW